MTGPNQYRQSLGCAFPCRPSELLGANIYPAEVIRAPIKFAQSLWQPEGAIVEDEEGPLAQVWRPKWAPNTSALQHTRSHYMGASKLEGTASRELRSLLGVAHLIVKNTVGRDILLFDELTQDRYDRMVTAQQEIFKRMAEEAGNVRSGVVIAVDADNMLTAKGESCEVPDFMREYVEVHNLNVLAGTLDRDVMADMLKEDFEQ